MSSQVAEPQKSLVCTFKAPSQEKRKVWSDYCQAVKDDGLDICRVTIGFAEAYLAAQKGEGVEFKTEQGKTIIEQHNVFTYQISKPRREPYSLECVKLEFRRTFSSLLFEAYVIEKARTISREFSFRDFLELKHDAFRRIVLRLKRKGKIIAHPQRTNPRFYILTERIKIT